MRSVVDPGINVSDIVDMATNPGNVNPEVKEASLKCLGSHLQKVLRFHHRVKRRKHSIRHRPVTCFRVFTLQYLTSYVCIMYLLTKTLYLVNVFFQIYALNK